MKKLLLSILAVSLLASCNGAKTEDKKTDTNSKANVESSTETKKDEKVAVEKKDQKVEEKTETKDEKVATDEKTEEKKVEPKTEGGEKTYKGDKFSFAYPANWTLSEPQGMVQVLSPLGEGDLFAENVNFISQNFKSLGVDYDKYYKLNIDSVKTMLNQNSGKITSEEDVKVAGVDAKKFVYEFTMQGAKIKTTQYFMNKGDDAYIVTFTNTATAPDEKKAEFAKVLETLKLK